MHMSHNNSAFNIFTSFFIIFFLLLQPSSFSSALVLFSSYCYYYYYYHHTTTTVTATATTTATKEKMSRSGDHQKYATLEVEGESSGVPRENTKGKTPIMEAPLIGKSGTYSNEKEGSETNAAAGVKRGVSVIDFVVRLLALVAALAATIIMGTTDQTLPFFTQFFQFRARYYDLPSFTYFVIANAITAAYLVLSLPFSIVTIVRPLANAPRLVLIIFDTIALTLITSAAASAAAIVYLAHKGNTNTNWIAICQQFDSFCSRSSGAVVASFIAAVLFILLVILSTVALKSH